MSVILSHSDSVSGTTIFDDGTKLYWTEGFTFAIAIKSDGKRIRIEDVHSPATEEEVTLLRRDADLVANGADEYRTMTAGEEREWSIARYGVDLDEDVI